MWNVRRSLAAAAVVGDIFALTTEGQICWGDRKFKRSANVKRERERERERETWELQRQVPSRWCHTAVDKVTKIEMKRKMIELKGKTWCNDSNKESVETIAQRINGRERWKRGRRRRYSQRQKDRKRKKEVIERIEIVIFMQQAKEAASV